MTTRKLTIDVPDQLYQYLQDCNSGQSLNVEQDVGNAILLIIEDHIKERQARLNDSLIQLVSNESSGSHDVSQNHDRYLYDK